MPPAEAQIAIERLRNRLLLSDAQALDALARAYGPIWASLEGRIIELIELQQRRGLKAWQVQRLRRYEELLVQVQERVEQYSIYASGRISEAQRAAVGLAGSGTRDVVGRALPRGISLDTLNRVGIAWNTLPAEAFEAFIGIAGDGAPLGRLLAPLGAEAREAVRQGIAEGIALGKGPRETARVVQQKVGMPLTRSLTISRTETLRAYREASRLQYGANSNIVKGYRRLAAQDDRVCPACIALDGTLYQTNTPLDAHPNCRCAMVPETVSYRDLGLDIPDEPLPGTARDWLEGLEPERQQKILGKARFEGWQRGQFQLTDMAKIHSDPVWGDSAVAKPVRELVA